MDGFVADAQAMEALGAALCASCAPGSLIYLYGELGAGKTTVVRGFLRALGHEGAVKSPTFTLVEPYRVGSHAVCHLDLYRLSDPEELEYIGIRDFLAEQATLLVEWPEQGAGMLPAPDIEVHIEYADGGRQVRIRCAPAVAERLRRQWRVSA